MQDPRRLKSRERLNRSVAVMAAANKTVWGIHTMDDPLFLNQNLEQSAKNYSQAGGKRCIMNLR